MADTKRPLSQLEFHGVYTAGNPAGRPRGTASKCENFRVMPDFWLRTAGGRKGRSFLANSGEAMQFHTYREYNYPGSNAQLVQVKYTGSVAWTTFSILTYNVDTFVGVETISESYDSAWCRTNPAAICNLVDRPMFYNGLGVRGATSMPAFSCYYGSATLYAGLDAFCQTGTYPTVAFAAGAGYNTVATRVRIFVGLYNAATGHYSNGIYCGTITTTGGTGTITVSNLNRLTYATHGSTETATLSYVFYATIDGAAYTVPYLIMNSQYTGPLTCAVANSSQSLSVVSGTNNGWVLDLTKEIPYLNHPPRPMRSVAYVNGRVYGVPMTGGSGNAMAVPFYTDLTPRSDFTYQPTSRDKVGVVWSGAYSDNYHQNHPGDPLQCWPLQNYASTPNGEQPVIVCPAQDGQRVLVITNTGTFYLTESADGIHEWAAISEIHGIGKAKTLVQTKYGIVWTDQNRQIVMLPKGGNTVEILSGHYQALINAAPLFADYRLDPPNEIDRYDLWLTGGTRVSHDFRLGGEAYTKTNETLTCASTLVAQDGTRHHVVASRGVYTQEAQPADGLIPTTDDTYDGSGQIVTTQISGEYHRNWDDFGDSSVRKEFDYIDLTADAELSALLSAYPVQVDWYCDFEQVAGANTRTAQIDLLDQSDANTPTSYTLRARFGLACATWIKLVLKLTGHSSDDSSFANHVNPSIQGDQAKNFYGCILKALYQVKNMVNRP